MARRAPVEVRAPHHRPDPDQDRRPGGRRRPVEDARRPDREDGSSEPSTTARWDSRPGAPISRAKRTSTDFSSGPRAPDQTNCAGKAVRHQLLSTSGFRWHTTHPRFNADTYPNEANRFGWVVEIDPFNPKSTPVKRTALGRLKHEGAWVQETKDGKIVVYMGDDERNEYIYRYVSNLPWRVARRQGNQSARRRHSLRRQVPRRRHG